MGNTSKTLLVTGSSGLIGSEVCAWFARELGCAVHGIDNNQRAVFFGPQGDTRWNQQRLARELPGFQHHELDIRDRTGDHICYYSDLRKMRAHYPSWDITQSLEDTIRQIVEAWQRRGAV